jgi:phosphatidylglycerophosphatase GEP4
MLGQQFNSTGIGFFLQIIGVGTFPLFSDDSHDGPCMLTQGNKPLAMPHMSVEDISMVDWPSLKSRGFEGVIFDKDNTLTRPYNPVVEPKLRASLESCLTTFSRDKVVLFSNSAGLEQYDPESKEAEALELSLRIHVLRHREKKPGGSKQEVEKHFGCESFKLIMVGDRYLTDIVYGNRHSMLTIRTKPLTSSGEPLGVTLARKVEDALVSRWSRQDIKAPPHALLV